MIELIKAIQTSNLGRQQKTRAGRSEILDQLTALVNDPDFLTLSSRDSHATSNLASPDTCFLNLQNTQLKTLEGLKKLTPPPQSQSLGTLIFKTDHLLFDWVLIETLIRCLPDGNALIVFLSEEQKTIKLDVWNQLAQKYLTPSTLQFLPDSPSAWQLALQHPGVKGVYSHITYGNSFAELSEFSNSLIKKSYGYHMGGKSTFCILEGADLDLAIQDLMTSLTQGMGLLSINPSRVLVQQKIEAEFKVRLKLATKAWEGASKANPPARAVPINPSQVLSNQGRIWAQNNDLHFLENISNCSEWHHLPLHYPLALLMDIKYPFEICKWINPLPNPINCTIWCDPNKNLDWLRDLETASLRINTPFDQYPWSFWSGAKEALYGHSPGSKSP